ncbi:stage VI sporulation protein F [Cohnella sp. LGH]|uniref:Stage VI sporulation protein F n=1 Tax=Cohnella phaseoli TaxID=456490 RepID=A0A3D9IAD0_9BACL|nr:MULTISPECIES: stage VI sporulation protein F [Cohnella]QTH44840.1 stage VI sporulation protein F [Cohnella sp. LGH]RED58667.1 stage VI sporulation protein F [Cohnella phaseoli]
MDKFPKDLLGAVNKKSGKNISEKSVKKIANNVTSTTMQSEAQMRQLIKQVSAMANVPVTEETIKEIIGTVKKSGMNLNSLESLVKMMIKK